jgi:glucose repression mediator protein
VAADALQGSLTELMGDPEGAIDAYQQALRHNQWSVTAMNAISHILRAREKFPEAMEFLRSILKLDPNNGDVWGSLGMPEPPGGWILKLILTGHCYLMMDNLQEAYTAYQQALYYLRDPKVRPGVIPGRAWLMLP